MAKLTLENEFLKQQLEELELKRNSTIKESVDSRVDDENQDEVEELR